MTAGASVTFTAAASGTPAPACQWQESVDGGNSWTNLVGYISGSLSLSRANISGDEYRAVFTNSAGTATTAPVTLTVTPVAPPAGDVHAWYVGQNAAGVNRTITIF